MTSLSKKRCLLDTNIFVAFINRKHRFHRKAKFIFGKVLDLEFKTIVSLQNILELSAVLTHGFKKTRSEVSSDINNIMEDSLIEVVYPDFRVLVKFSSLMKTENTLHMTDLFLLSTALVYKAEVIVTGDRAFEKIKTKEIRVYNPFE